MLAGTEVLWPEVENYYYLMKMRVSDGPAFFDSEKQNEPIHPEDCLFREEWFAYWDDAASATPAAGTIVLAPSTLPWAWPFGPLGDHRRRGSGKRRAARSYNFV